MTPPSELLRKLDEVERKVDRMGKGQSSLKRSIQALRTMTIGHYEDVSKFARTIERRVDRIESRLGLPPIEPEPPPRALPDPP